MSIITDVIRPFSLVSLSTVKEAPSFPLSEWLEIQDYQIYNTIKNNKFTLNISNENSFLRSLLFDLDRMAIAAFESMHCINQDVCLTKSRAWLVVKAYYSAYFAAHAILRLLGQSCSWLYPAQTRKIEQVNALFHVNNVKLSQGYYHFKYYVNSKEIECKSMSSAKGGSHELFWKVFLKQLQELSSRILGSLLFPQDITQAIFSKLSDLNNVLCHEGQRGGSWLSSIRNQVNYRHQHHVWFPYRHIRKQDVVSLYNKRRLWCEDPMKISLIIKAGSKIDLFYNACHFLVGMCRVILEDLCSRSSSGWLKMGSIRLLKTLNCYAL
ncbi:hypothetical protein CKA32_004807 [Geitlerinema sp. FC II]|nr:hypothetical protein CKA32_004807 [Geitlerinema sp. FC II]